MVIFVPTLHVTRDKLRYIQMLSNLELVAELVYRKLIYIERVRKKQMSLDGVLLVLRLPLAHPCALDRHPAGRSMTAAS